MNKKILLALGIICTLTSCNSQINSESSDKISGDLSNISQENSDTPLNSKLLRTPNENEKASLEELNDEGYKIFKNKLSAFSSKLNEKVFDEVFDGSNSVISPLSIYMALALVTSCSDGNTRQEVLDALGMSYDEVKKYTSTLYKQSNKEYHDDDGGIYLKEKVTNSIWFDDDITYSLNDKGLDELANNYYCYPYEVDFDNNNTVANEAIRQFVKENTKGKIDQDFMFDDETVLLLINTLYLKDVWNFAGLDLPFTKDNYSFKNIEGNVKQSKFLEGYYNSGKVYETNTYRSFYTTTTRYKISFIVPTDGYDIKDLFTENTINEVSNISYQIRSDDSTEMYETRCLFPEFKADTDINIHGILQSQFNINDLFSPGYCNFNNISNYEMFCKYIRHVAVLDVDKTGIEGAAVTIVASDGTAAPEPIKIVYDDFVVDKSFGFVISDAGIPLFTGIINQI